MEWLVLQATESIRKIIATLDGPTAGEDADEEAGGAPLRGDELEDAERSETIILIKSEVTTVHVLSSSPEMLSTMREKHRMALSTMRLSVFPRSWVTRGRPG